MDLVERVAKHLHERQSMWPWDSVQDKKAKLTEARAAAEEMLSAQKEPSEAMIDAGFRARSNGMTMAESATATWQAMLAQFRKESGL